MINKVTLPSNTAVCFILLEVRYILRSLGTIFRILYTNFPNKSKIINMNMPFVVGCHNYMSITTILTIVVDRYI